MKAELLGDGSLGGKPDTGALFTSEMAGDWPGPWHIYATARAIHEPPWQLWDVEAESTANILRIGSAAEWCSFVAQFPRETPAGLIPDWHAASSSWDAVSLDFLATAAIDAVGFVHHGMDVAPTFWGVPTTVWLTWKIARVSASDLPRQF